MLISLTLSLALMMGNSAAMDEYLGRAIERGVPLFNQGMPEACAAVYATALEGIADSDGWGLEAAQRANLRYQLDLAVSIPDPSEQAWAYRRIIDALLNGAPLAAPASSDSRSLFDFTVASDFEKWRIVVDGVMGGRSTGLLEQQQDVLVFTGVTSLENNGGFSSIRAPVPEGSLAGYDSLRIRVKGDGRSWILGARDRSDRGAGSYWSRFETIAGEWQTVTVPITGMVRHYFGNPTRGSLSPADIRGIEFYIYDKQAGPFRLEVDQIEAVRSRTIGVP
jgi:NADH dehydrogenase [ubiquinone] 1 alpha subcomplex assembly factor 1